MEEEEGEDDVEVADEVSETQQEEISQTSESMLVQTTKVVD